MNCIIFSQCLWHYAFESIVAGGQTLPDASDSVNEDSEVEYSQQEPGAASRLCDLS